MRNLLLAIGLLFFSTPAWAAYTSVPNQLDVTNAAFGAKCDGTTDDRSAFNAANINGAFIVSYGECAIGSNLTITQPVTFFQTGMIKPANGVTVIFKATVNAAAQKICDISAGGHCDFTAIPNPAYVEWWGAVGGSTDYDTPVANHAANTTAFTEAMNYMPSSLYAMNSAYSVTGLIFGAVRGGTLYGAGPNTYTLIGSGIPFAYAAHIPNSATFTGTISGTTLTVSAIATGSLKVGMTISGSGVSAYTTIRSQLSGSSGSTGTYGLSVSQTVSGSTAMIVTDPCHTNNTVVQNGASGQAVHLVGFGVTSNSLSVASVMVCATDTTMGDPQLSWTIDAERSLFGGAFGASPGAYAGWIWEWNNGVTMTNDVFNGDTYAEALILPDVLGNSLALQKIGHVGGTWSSTAAGTPTHGTLLYEANNSSHSGLLDAHSWSVSPHFESGFNGFVLDAGGQLFETPWIERINPIGTFASENPVVNSTWIVPASNVAIVTSLVTNLAANSTVIGLGATTYLYPPGQGLLGIGAGSPNGSVNAGRGSIWSRTDSSDITKTPCYQFNATPGNTGWVNGAGSSC